MVSIPDSNIWSSVYSCLASPPDPEAPEAVYSSDSENELWSRPENYKPRFSVPKVQEQEKICSLSKPLDKRTYTEDKAKNAHHLAQEAAADQQEGVTPIDQESDVDVEIEPPLKRNASKDVRVNPGSALSCSCSTKPGGFWDLIRNKTWKNSVAKVHPSG